MQALPVAQTEEKSRSLDYDDEKFLAWNSK